MVPGQRLVYEGVVCVVKSIDETTQMVELAELVNATPGNTKSVPRAVLESIRPSFTPFNVPSKTFHIYVDAYVKNIAGEFVNAGKAHQVEYIIQAESDVAAMIKFRQEHPDLEMADCEENILVRTNNTAQQAQKMNEGAKISGGTWKKMLGLSGNK